MIKKEQNREVKQKNIEKQLPIILAVLLVTAMTAAAELSGEREILFPEIAAIAAGALIAPKFAWKTSYIRLFVFISIGAVVGLSIVSFTAHPLSIQMSIAFLIASILYQFSGTTFAPMISSIVLPVMLQTKSIVYPIAAVILTFFILMARKLIEQLKIAEPVEYVPELLPNKQKIFDLVVRWLIGSGMIFLAVHFGFKFAAAPPLLVAFTEFWKPESAAQKKPVKITLMIVGCAFIGAFSRYIFILLGWYLFIAAGVTILIVCIIMRKTKLYVPPAAALSILAFLIPQEVVIWYPLQIAIGTFLLISAALLHGRKVSA